MNNTIIVIIASCIDLYLEFHVSPVTLQLIIALSCFHQSLTL